MTAKQFYSPIGQQIKELESKKDALIKKQGYYSKGAAKIGNRISKLYEKLEKQTN